MHSTSTGQHWSSLLCPRLYPTAPSPRGRASYPSDRPKATRSLPRGTPPGRLRPSQPTVPFRLSSAYTSAVPSRRLLGCEPGRAPQRLWSPGRKQGPTPGVAMGSAEQRAAPHDPGWHPSLHPGPNTPLAHQALPAQAHTHNRRL